ncbi:MAG: hypothetical protein H7Z37_15120 [Pyrinomonadaceae bacterium]|nr:hypothetical protein [Pyrinomonadaceae bacterium]
MFIIKTVAMKAKKINFEIILFNQKSATTLKKSSPILSDIAFIAFVAFVAFMAFVEFIAFIAFRDFAFRCELYKRFKRYKPYNAKLKFTKPVTRTG